MWGRVHVVIIAAALVVAAALPSTAAGKSIGGCPSGDGWELVTVAELGIDPEIASGIPSLDGNGDGLTCIMGLENYPRFPDAFVFRDNTVGP
jgi:hypothetical protein